MGNQLILTGLRYRQMELLNISLGIKGDSYMPWGTSVLVNISLSMLGDSYMPWGTSVLVNISLGIKGDSYMLVIRYACVVEGRCPNRNTLLFQIRDDLVSGSGNHILGEYTSHA